MNIYYNRKINILKIAYFVNKEMLCIPNQIIRCLLIEIFYIIRNDHLFSQDLKWLFGTNMFTLFMLVEKNYLKYLDICPHNI